MTVAPCLLLYWAIRLSVIWNWARPSSVLSSFIFGCIGVVSSSQPTLHAIHWDHICTVFFHIAAEQNVACAHCSQYREAWQYRCCCHQRSGLPSSSRCGLQQLNTYYWSSKVSKAFPPITFQPVAMQTIGIKMVLVSSISSAQPLT